MFIRLVKLTIASENVKDFNALFEKYRHAIRNQPGCQQLDLLNDRKNPEIFFTYSVWDTEESLENYRNSELFEKVWDTAKTFFAARPEAWSVNTIVSL